MALNWEQGALAEGLACYRRQEFFLTHEHWESVWLGCAEPEKTFLQSLIQIAAAFHHLQRSNCAGTRSLLGRALGRLEAYPAGYGGVNVEGVRRSVRVWLKALDSGEARPALPFPAIQ